MAVSDVVLGCIHPGLIVSDKDAILRAAEVDLEWRRVSAIGLYERRILRFLPPEFDPVCPDRIHYLALAQQPQLQASALTVPLHLVLANDRRLSIDKYLFGTLK